MDQEFYRLLGFAYGLVLLGLILMSLSTVGKDSFLVSHVVMDISIHESNCRRDAWYTFYIAFGVYYRWVEELIFLAQIPTYCCS